MKYFLLFISILFSGTLAAQYWRNPTPFSFRDSVLQEGEILRNYSIKFIPGQKKLDSVSFPFLDSLADFLWHHDDVAQLKIAVHLSWVPASNQVTLSMNRGLSISDYLVHKGIASQRLLVYGYSHTEPLYTDKEIAAAKTKREQDSLRKLNGRIDFQVTKLTKFFSLTGTQFDTGMIFRTRRIRFDFDGGAVLPESYPLVDSIARFMIAHPQFVFDVGEFTSSPGSDEFNQKLSQMRAMRLCTRLSLFGVPPAQMQYTGYGESAILYNDNPETGISKELAERDRLLNLRTEIRIIPENYSHPVFSFSDTIFFPGEIIRLQMNFTFSHPDLTDESKQRLDSLAIFLKAHPYLRFEIGSFTDQRGSDANNLQLSELRANFIMNYLVHTDSVNATQLTAHGYGESQPLHSQEEINRAPEKEQQEKLYAENRRTEFKIISAGR